MGVQFTDVARFSTGCWAVTWDLVDGGPAHTREDSIRYRHDKVDVFDHYKVHWERWERVRSSRVRLDPYGQGPFPYQLSLDEVYLCAELCRVWDLLPSGETLFVYDGEG